MKMKESPVALPRAAFPLWLIVTEKHLAFLHGFFSCRRSRSINFADVARTARTT